MCDLTEIINLCSCSNDSISEFCPVYAAIGTDIHAVFDQDAAAAGGPESAEAAPGAPASEEADAEAAPVEESHDEVVGVETA